MTLTLDITSDLAVGLESKATAKGLSIQDYLKHLVERDQENRNASAESEPVGLEAVAAANGLSIQDYLNKLVDEARQRDQYVHLPPDEFTRRLDAIAERYRADDLPTLSDEAISRESIYAERGL